MWVWYEYERQDVEFKRDEIMKFFTITFFIYGIWKHNHCKAIVNIFVTFI